jgi:hypothetical protein
MQVRDQKSAPGFSVQNHPLAPGQQKHVVHYAEASWTHFSEATSTLALKKMREAAD